MDTETVVPPAQSSRFQCIFYRFLAQNTVYYNGFVEQYNEFRWNLVRGFLWLNTAITVEIQATSTGIHRNTPIIRRIPLACLVWRTQSSIALATPMSQTRMCSYLISEVFSEQQLR